MSWRCLVPAGYAAHSCFIHRKTHRNTNFSNHKIKWIYFEFALFVISSVPAMNYLFKVSHWSRRIRCEKCSRLRMKTLERCEWRHSSVFIVNYEHISSFVLIIEFEQAKVCWVHIEKKNTFEDKIGYIMRYVAVFWVWTKFINKWHLNLYHQNPTGESVGNICKGVYFRRWFWLKRCRSHTKWPAAHLSFYRFCSYLT